MKKALLLLALSALSLLVAGCSGGEDASPPEKSGVGTSHLQQAGGDGAAGGTTPKADTPSSADSE